MSADRDDFTGNLTLELPYVKPAEKPRQVGGLRATGWPLAYRDAEEQARWAVSPELPPEIVTLTALWEFCRMLMLAPAFTMTLIHPHVQFTAWYFWRIYFVASNGAVTTSWMSAVSFLYTLMIGVCLWNPVFWARWLLVGTSLYSALALGRFVFLFSSYAETMGNASAAGLGFLHSAAFALIALNLIIAIGMAFAPGVAYAFRRKD